MPISRADRTRIRLGEAELIPSVARIMTEDNRSREDAIDAQRMEIAMARNMRDRAVVIEPEPPKPKLPGYVYFLESADTGLIKIGFSTNVEQRARAIESMGGSAVRLLATKPGTFKTERRLHRRFAAWRTRGEWFEPNPALLDLIEDAALLEGDAGAERADSPRPDRTTHK